MAFSVRWQGLFQVILQLFTGAVDYYFVSVWRFATAAYIQIAMFNELAQWASKATIY